jgi:hypothetical protein
VGEVAPTVGSNLIVDYESGADITAGMVTGNYLQLYDVDMDEEGRIAAFYQVKLTAEDIRKEGIKEDTEKEILEEEGMTVGIAEEDEPDRDMVMHSIAPVSSEDILGTYELGINVIGTLYIDGKLVISGQGEMYDYEAEKENHPLSAVQSQITSVEIKSGVTNIGAWMFCLCKNLESVTIPNTVTSIGEFAFLNCTGLASITIPSSVTSIGNNAFRCCFGLTSVTIPSSVTSIGSGAFAVCRGLTSVTFAEQSQITSIGNNAFLSCIGLTSITIPSSVISIGSFAFLSCIELASVTIPSSVTSIGEFAFSYCLKLTSIEIDTSNQHYSSEDGVLFNKDKSKLIQYPSGNTRTSYTVPSSVTSIGDSAFEDCIELTSVTIPSSVTSIGEFAFSYCLKLTSIEIDTSNQHYSSEDGVLLNKDKSKLIQYPSGNTRTSYTIPTSVTIIGDYAFEECTGLTSVTIPSSITSIGSYAFYGCTGLTSLIIPTSITSIGGYAFAGCTGLTSMTIPSTVASIGKSAFVCCTGLTSITNQYYGNQIIGDYAFNTDAPNPKYAYAYSANENFINAAKVAGYTIEYLVPGSSSGKRRTQSTPAQGSAIVIFNGEEHNAGKEIKTTEDEKSTVIIELNDQVIESIIYETIRDNSIGTRGVIQIPITDASSQVAKVELTGDIVKKLAENSFDAFIQWNNIDYNIPAEEFTISNVAENLGVPEKDLQDIKVEVKITKIDETAVAHYNEVVKANGAELIFPPVEFEIAAKTIKSDNTTEEVKISKFSNYVERVMEIPAGIDPSKITTGIVFNSDGSYSHVPTQVYQKDDKWYAKLNSLTNSPYSVMWNLINVSSVENHWAKESVNDMSSRLVVFNPENFVPNKAITRADFVEYIVRALGLYQEGSEHKNNFGDVSGTGERTLAILIANEYGIVTGYPDSTFRPDQQITREEAMAMYQRAMQITKLTGSDQDRYLNYTDFAKVSSWAEAYVKEVLSAHVFNGTTATTISPKSNLTYAEAAQAIKNLLVKSKLINQ